MLLPEVASVPDSYQEASVQKLPQDQMGESLGTLKPGWTAGVCTLEYTVLLLLMIGMYACFR